MRRVSARVVALLLALAVAGPAVAAAAAYVCHPDPAGTRSLSLHGTVVAYDMRGTAVAVEVTRSSRCRALVWRIDLGRVVRTRACGSSVAPRRSAARQVRLVAGSAGAADRLQTLRPDGRVARSWPLPVRAKAGTLEVSRGLASFLARGRSGLWVLRLSDGRATFVAPVPTGDRPALGAQGVVYRDAVYKGRPADRPLLKFVPTRALDGELARVERPLHTGGPIRSFAVDGTRVALVVGGRDAGGCDRVVFWNIPWRSADQISEQHGPTCGPLGGSGRIASVALAGSRAEWVTSHRGRAMLVAADDVACQEWVIRRLSDLAAGWSLAGIGGAGPTLAYALVDRSSGSTASAVGRVDGHYRAHRLFSAGARVQDVAVDGRRTAVLYANGSIAVHGYRGRVYRAFSAPGARSIAVEGSLLVAQTGADRLQVYDLTSGLRVHSWALRRGAAKVDLQYGLAVVSAGRSVFGVDVATGRTARLAVAPAPVAAQIGSIGVVYAYSRHGLGTAKLIPMRALEAALR